MSVSKAWMLPEVVLSNPPINIKRDDFPEPEGPINPSDDPFTTSNEIPLNMSICPEFADKERWTSLRLYANSVIGSSLYNFRNVLFPYGAVMFRNKLVGWMLASFLSGAPVWAEPVVVAAFGDSLTQGYGLPAEDGFPAQLEDWLQAQGLDVTIINAGVSGDTTAGGLARIEWTLTEDVDAVIVELGANDLLRGLPPEEARRNLTGIMEVISGRNLPALLAGIPAPQNYGAEYKSAFDSIYVDLADKHDAIYYRNFLQGIGEAGDLAEVAKLMQSDGLHPNKEGVARVVAHIGPLVLELIAKVEN